MPTGDGLDGDDSCPVNVFPTNYGLCGGGITPPGAWLM